MEPFERGSFFRELDAATRPFRWTTIPPGPTANGALAAAILRAADALVLSEKVYFKVFGENVVLAALVETMGVRVVEELLESRAISFLLWKPLVLAVEGEGAPSELRPITTGTSTLEEYSDPLVSAQAGLYGWSSLGRRHRERLSEKAAQNTVVLPDDIADAAVERLFQAHAMGDLASHGIPDELSIGTSSDATLKTLSQFAISLFEAAASVSADANIFEAAPTWDAILETCRHIRMAHGVVEISQQALRNEVVPSVADLILHGHTSFDKIPEIRNRVETRDYRKWLWNEIVGGNDFGDVKAAYNALLNSVGGVGARGKLVRLGANALVSTLAGAAVTAVTGGDFVHGMVAGVLTSGAVYAADSFWVDGLLRERKPHRYASEVLRAYAFTSKEGQAMRSWPGANMKANFGKTPTGNAIFTLSKPATRDIVIPVGITTRLLER